MFVIESYGAKHGEIEYMPHVLLDVRHLWNPYHDESLRAMTGLDDRLRSTLTSRSDYKSYLGAVEALLQTMVPSKVDTIYVAVRCTGGRHRSVTVAEVLKESLIRYRKVQTQHRDVGRE
jgi:UPF0042 nucleotide-binding protein